MPRNAQQSRRAEKPRGAQQWMPGFDAKTKLAFGGGRRGSRTHPVSARPVSTKQAIHIVMRSEMARGGKSMLLNAGRIEAILKRQGRKHGVRLYEHANGGNHLHLIVKPERRGALAPFLRSAAGLIARLVLKAERGRPAPELDSPAEVTRRPLSMLARQSFWDARPFSRIVSWGRDYSGLKNYLTLNRLETRGFAKVAGRAALEILRELTRRGLITRDGTARLLATGFNVSA